MKNMLIYYVSIFSFFKIMYDDKKYKKIIMYNINKIYSKKVKKSKIN